TPTRRKARNARAEAVFCRVVIRSAPRLAHEPMRTNTEEDHQQGEYDEISDVAEVAQQGEADRFHHAENETSCNGAADDSCTADHDHQKGLDGNRTPDARVD